MQRIYESWSHDLVMTTFLNLFKNIPHNSTLIIGFSGGPDSVFLLNFLSNIAQSHNLKIIAAHLDHQWRPNSYQDAAWCSSFCKQYNNVTFISKAACELNFTPKTNGSKEETGRKLRRHFFMECAKDFKADHIVLGHHQNDQIETFFIRLSRGSSVTGLGSMRMKDGLYLRPLLDITKQEILDFLELHQIPFLTDPTNIDTVFLRNRIRKNLVPILESIDTRLNKNIISCIDHMQKTEDFLKLITEQKIKELSIDSGLNLTGFLSCHEILQQRMILSMLISSNQPCTPSKAFFSEIIRFLRSEKHNEHQLLATLKIIKNKNSFYFKTF
jgi:tRNA(Ile)-lysidine synthase